MHSGAVIGFSGRWLFIILSAACADSKRFSPGCRLTDSVPATSVNPQFVLHVTACYVWSDWSFVQLISSLTHLPQPQTRYITNGNEIWLGSMFFFLSSNGRSLSWAEEMNVEIKTLRHAHSSSLNLMQVEVWVERILGNVCSSHSSKYKSAYGLNMRRKAFKQQSAVVEAPCQTSCHSSASFLVKHAQMKQVDGY